MSKMDHTFLDTFTKPSFAIGFNREAVGAPKWADRWLRLPMGATVMTKGSLGGPQSPKETLTRPRAPSPGPPGPLLSRFERDAITCDSCGTSGE